METSASCEARSAPSSYPTTEGTTLSKQRLLPQAVEPRWAACPPEENEKHLIFTLLGSRQWPIRHSLWPRMWEPWARHLLHRK